jgi:uncharacterized protein (DUF427 family)
MARVVWNRAVLAESDRFEVVEGTVYFPSGLPRRELLRHCQAQRMAGMSAFSRGVQVEP